MKEINLGERGESVPNVTPVITFPYEISFPDSEPSAGVRTKIEEYLAKLGRIHDRITDCKVFVRIPHRHGGLRYFHIHVQLDVPGKRIVASREPEENDDHADISMAIKDAFKSVTRQLDDFLRGRKEFTRPTRAISI